MINQENSTVQTDGIEVPTSLAVQIRKPKKKKRQATVRKEYEVKVIPATKGVIPIGEVAPTKRVAAYCRVSTDEEAQATSYDLQVQHYTEYIAAHDGWVLAGIYADEGLSGTQTKKREQFNQMIQDCEDGKVDMVLTKSISRFARNTVDCLTNIRKLKSLNPPVEIYFEKERLYSLDDKTDILFPVFILPSSIWGSKLGIQDASTLNTIFMLRGAKGTGNIYGEMPVDLISLSYMQFGIIGLFIISLVYAFLFCKIYKSVKRISNTQANRMICLYVVIVIGIETIFYADPQHIVYSTFAFIIFMVVYNIFSKITFTKRKSVWQ